MDIKLDYSQVRFQEDGGRGDDSRLYAQYRQPFGNGRPGDLHVVQRVFRPGTSGHLF